MGLQRGGFRESRVAKYIREHTLGNYGKQRTGDSTSVRFKEVELKIDRNQEVWSSSKEAPYYEYIRIPAKKDRTITVTVDMKNCESWTGPMMDDPLREGKTCPSYTVSVGAKVHTMPVRRFVYHASRYINEALQGTHMENGKIVRANAHKLRVDEDVKTFCGTPNCLCPGHMYLVIKPMAVNDFGAYGKGTIVDDSIDEDAPTLGPDGLNCWEWEGPITRYPDGYARPVYRYGRTTITISRYVMKREMKAGHFQAHDENGKRVAVLTNAYTLTNNCGNDKCVRPEHFDVRKRRMTSFPERCKRGHEMYDSDGMSLWQVNRANERVCPQCTKLLADIRQDLIKLHIKGKLDAAGRKWVKSDEYGNMLRGIKTQAEWRANVFAKLKELAA